MNTFVVPDVKNGVLYAAEEFPLDAVPELASIANNAFEDWKSVSRESKSKIFTAFARNLQDIKEPLVKEHLRVGISESFSHFNVEGSIAQILHYADVVKTIPEGENVEGGVVLKEPLGAVLSISPWNAPGILATRAIMAPLAAGCSVVLKGSHLSPEVSYMISKALVDVGGDVPEGLVQTIHTSSEGSKAIVGELVANGNIRGVNFTGSTKTGREIGKLCGQWLKPCVLELGGKNCTIIDKGMAQDKLKRALEDTIVSGMFNTGQVCMCTDTVYVHNEEKDRVETMMCEILDGFRNETMLGFNNTMRTTTEHGRLQRVLDRALWKDGFKTVWKNHSLKDTHGPVLLTEGHDDSTIWTTELFGPLMCVRGYETMDEALEHVNSTGYGLKCSIWTDRDNKKELARKVNCGSVHFNQMTIFDEPHLPHGGVGLSGMGRFNSKWGIASFQYDKLVTGL